MTVVSIMKFLIKLILFIIFLPIIFVGLLFGYMRYKAMLVRNMVHSGMPREYALELAKETRFSHMFKFGKKSIMDELKQV